MDNNEKDNIKENEEVNTCSNKQILYEDSEGNYRYRGFWSGFGDQ